MARVQQSTLIVEPNFNYVMDYFIPGIIVNIHEFQHYYTHHLYCQGFSDEQYDKVLEAIQGHDFFKATLAVSNNDYDKTDDEILPHLLITRSRPVDPGYDYYIISDDDFEFKAGSFATYSRSVDYLEANPSCSSVLSGSYMGSVKKGLDPEPYVGFQWVGRGYVMRNLEKVDPDLFDRCYWREAMGWKDCFIDDFTTLHPPLQFGFYQAKIWKNPTLHHNFPPPYTEENFKKRVPSRLHSYFDWKLRRSNFVVKGTWKKFEQEFEFLSKVFKLPPTFDETSNADMMAHCIPSKSFIKEVYRPAAIARFGSTVH